MIKSFIQFGMLMMTLALFTLPVENGAYAATNWLPGDFVGDQSFTFGGASGSGWEVNYLWNTRQMARVGQEFTPTLPALNVVDLVPFTCEGCSPQWLFVRIRKASIFGLVVGISYPVKLDAANNDTHTRFPFPSMIHLKPGDRYVIEVVPLWGNANSILWYGEPGVDFYPGGRAIANSKPVSTADIWFEEGVIVTIPRSSFDCMFSGWQYLLRRDNSAFNNQGECIRYVRSGH
jgi:hypothetical protein